MKLLTEHNLKFLSLRGGYRGSSESIHVKMPHCWKSHALAQIKFNEAHIRIIVFKFGQNPASGLGGDVI